MNIKITGREQILSRLSHDPNLADKFKIISINDPEDPYIWGKTYPAHNNVLSLKFHDIVADERTIENFKRINGGQYTLFNEDHAEQIIYFLTELEPTDNLLVHCFAGISRSGAIGTFAREMFNLDYSSFKQINPQICPNVHILKVLTEKYQEMFGEAHVFHTK